MKAIIPRIRKNVPNKFVGQSSIPLDRFKQMFHTASVRQEKRRNGIPGFILQKKYFEAKVFELTVDVCQLDDN